MTRILRTTLVALVAALCLAGGAQAAGGNFVFVGGSDEAREQVRFALEASRFDWDVVPEQVTIQISRCGCGGARPGVIVLDEDILVSSPFGPRYAWGIVQHEYAHQVDFFLLDDADRLALASLGGLSWWAPAAVAHAPNGTLAHEQLTSERFASTLAWSYWQSKENSMRPTSPTDESAAMAPAAFRALLARVLPRS
jgi:hypothetical protein